MDEMNELEILGFNPQQLSVFNEPEHASTGNSMIYRTRPADSKSEDGVYRSIIKVIYNPHNLKNSVLEQQSYSMQDENGYFSVVSSLTVNDKNCPIFKAFKKCRYSPENSVLWKQQASKEQGGNALFDKRFARYVTIQVIEDKNQPELEGKYLFWKMPKSIWDIINVKMNPSKESGKPSIPVMDFLFGRSIYLEVTPGPDDPQHPERKTRETKYMGEISDDVVSCVNPDMSPLLNKTEQIILKNYVLAMTQVWKERDADKRAELQKKVDDDKNTKELRNIYHTVLEKIKSFCPDLIKELSYKEWTPEVTERVNNWINIVLSGNNPSNVTTLAATVAGAAKTVAAPAATTAATTAAEEDDDLPF